MSIISTGDAAAVAEQAMFGEVRARTLVNFIDNHDTKRFANEPGFGVANDEIRRRLQLALAVGDYRELWRPNGSPTTNVLSFWRVGGGERLLFVANGGAARRTVTLPLQGLYANGTMLADLFVAGAPSSVQVTNGSLALALPPKTVALYRPR